MFPFQDRFQLKIMFGSEESFPKLFLPYIIDRAGSYGRDVSFGRHDSVAEGLSRRKAIVEFSSPNLARAFEGKHLRSTILGEFVANLYESIGWDVVRLNYLGDWGKPIGLLGVGWERFGSEEAFQADPLGHLMQVYQQAYELFAPELEIWEKARGDALHGKIPEGGKDQAQIESEGIFAERNAFVKKMEEGEEKALAVSRRVREESIKNYVQLYAQMGITFDDYSGESQVSRQTMAEVEEMLKSKGLCEESGGSLIVDLKKYKLNVGIIRDRSGSYTYLLRDLAAVLERAGKYSFDKMLYVVAADHNNHTVHFSRIIKILELLGMSELSAKLQHVSFSETSQMPAKLGEAEVKLEQVLGRCQKAMLESLQANPDKALSMGDTEQMAASIGVSALVAQELATKRAHEHVFDLNSMVSFEPATGPNLRWWYSKLSHEFTAGSKANEIDDEDWASLGDEEINLLRLLIQWPDIVQSAYKSLESSMVMGYLKSVIGELSSCFDQLEASAVSSPAHALLYKASHIVLENALRLFGILPTQK